MNCACICVHSVACDVLQASAALRRCGSRNSAVFEFEFRENLRPRPNRLTHSKDLGQRRCSIGRRCHLVLRATDVRDQPSVLEEDVPTRKTRQITEIQGKKRLCYDTASEKLLGDAIADGTISFETNLIDFGKGLLLPRGYPHSVTDDYVPYQLWAFPCHIFGWISHSLSTSSLLKAVGVDLGGAAGAVGATAAVKWITKDGIGAVGRLIVGSRLGPVFDEDPKRWRMLSEVMRTGGMALELSTAFAPPAAFLLLAGSGNLAKAAGRGMGTPCFRIIQTHFAAANNNGDVAAKEEVWEVGAQLIGLSASIAILNAVQASGDPLYVLWAWGVCQAAHIFCRYQALSMLRLKSINHKRGGFLVSAHAADLPLPDPGEAGQLEANIIWLPTSAASPRLELGCTMSTLLQSSPRPGSVTQPATSNPTPNANSDVTSDATSDLVPASTYALNHSTSENGGVRTQPGEHSVSSGDGDASHSSALAVLLDVYGSAGYMLTWQNGIGRAILSDEAHPTASLQALWQAAYLEAAGIQDASAMQLSDSLTAAQEALPDLLQQAEAAGWDINNVPIQPGPCKFTLD